VVLASVKEEAATGKPLLLTTLLLAATGHASDALALPLALAREHEGGGCSADLLEELLLPPLNKAHNRAVMECFFLARLMSLAKSLDIKLSSFIFGY
jgi:hypothetical protein